MTTSSKTANELLHVKDVPQERLVLFDGHSIAYRSFYAIRDLTTRDGAAVNAVYGFWRFLTKIVRDFPSQYVAVAFDAGGVTFRHEMYPDYKANRQEMPTDLSSQLPIIQEMLSLLGIKIIFERGVEADDILGSIALKAGAHDLPVLIVTSDKDLAQLVDERINLVRPGGRGSSGGVEILDINGVRERFGVEPGQIVDYLSLIGDTSDNVPGVPSIGPKTAVKLLAQFGSLDQIIARADQLRNARIRDKLKEHIEDALLARRLVTLDPQIAVGDVPRDYALGDVDVGGLGDLLTKLNFNSVLKDLSLEPSPTKTESKQETRGQKAEYRTILTENELTTLVSEIARCDEISIDLETTSVDPMRARIVGISISPRPYVGYYIPVGHDYLGAPAQLKLETVLAGLRPFIEGERQHLIGQNIKYDLIVLYRSDLHPRGISFDAMIASHLINPEERRHNLERITETYLGYNMLSYTELAGKNGKISQVPVDKATFYAAEDAEIVYRVKDLLIAGLKRVGATKLFEEVEVPLVSVLARMEKNGILVDEKVLSAQGRDLRERLAVIESDLYEIAGEMFNPNSPKQIATVLFDHLGLPVIEKKKTGPSTSARVLSELAVQHPLPGKLIEYRELQKLLTTYIDRLPEAINPDTGRIHTSFHQTSTATGRLSSSDPNLQNIPTRTEVGDRIRRAFVSPDGSLLIGADYSQIEIRLLAHLSEDEHLISAFVEGKDLHRITASRIFAIPEDKVTGKLRNAAKRINFGIIYGISPFGLARELGISREEARAYIDRFFAAYPQARSYMDRMVEEAMKKGYAETILGRRRMLPQLSEKNVTARNFAKRNAVNTPIQGSAADLIKLAMLKLDRLIEDGTLKAKMLLQIHDELIFEAQIADISQASETIKKEMEGVMDLRVPLKVKVETGKNWSQI
ncbi:MAG: DNA polymerase I [Candidatus Bipolaricaulota bacterium]|nr:DNA polymerase I [Candidatus Bipolaricaulota bacterium]